MLSVVENLNSPRKEAENDGAQQDKISEDLKMTQRANQKLEKQLEDVRKK
jgi:hypothetical protein